MPSLLLVDDDPVIRAMFARTLQAHGEIDQAGGGGDALRLLGTKKYDLVMLDLHMPVIDGWVVLQMLANKPGPNRDTPVFVITADTSDRARVDALRRKAVFFLTKPVHLATLAALIDSALKKNAAKSAKPSRPGSMPDIDYPATDPRSRPVDDRAPGPLARPVDDRAPGPLARPVDDRAPGPLARPVDPRASRPGSMPDIDPRAPRPVLPGPGTPTGPNDPTKKRP